MAILITKKILKKTFIEHTIPFEEFAMNVRSDYFDTSRFLLNLDLDKLK